MFLKKITCLLLTLVFSCTVAVPALAGGDPPGTGGNIHPWDNNDDVRPGSGPLLSVRQPVIFGYGFNGRLVTLRMWSVAGVVKAQSSNAKAIPQRSGSLQVSTKNR